MYTNGRSLSSDTDFYKRQQEAIRQAKAAAEYSKSRSSYPVSEANNKEDPRQTPASYRKDDEYNDNKVNNDYKVNNDLRDNDGYKDDRDEMESKDAFSPERRIHKHEEKGLSGIKQTIKNKLKNIQEDDILLIVLFFLLFNENKEDDFLILIILAVLFFS